MSGDRLLPNSYEFLVFSKEITSRTTPQNPFVFAGKMCLVVNVTVNLYLMRLAPNFCIFCKENARRSNTSRFLAPRLGFNVTVQLYVMQPIAPKFLGFFPRKRASQESCHIPRVHFPCVFSSAVRLGFTSDCEFT